jgi:tetratricopeptide (TPR) repeat protein
MKKILFFKLFFLLFFMLFFAKSQSQTMPLKKLDSIYLAYKLKGDLEKAINFNIKELKNYEKAKNTDGIITVYINIAGLLTTSNNYKKSIEYLNKAKAIIKNTKNPDLHSRMYNGYGFNYSMLGFFEQSNENFNIALQYTSRIKDAALKADVLYNIYDYKWYNFEAMGKLDSVYAIQKKCLELMPHKPLIYVKIAERFIRKKKNIDSAKYYLDKAVPLLKIPMQKAFTFKIYGEYYSVQNDNKKALDFYIEALPIFEKFNKKNMAKETLKLISHSYRTLGNYEKADEYLKRYLDLNESINDNKEKDISITIDSLIKEREDS